MTLTFVRIYKFNSEFNFLMTSLCLLLIRIYIRTMAWLEIIFFMKWCDDNFMDLNVTTNKTQQQQPRIT